MEPRTVEAQLVAMAARDPFAALVMARWRALPEDRQRVLVYRPGALEEWAASQRNPYEVMAEAGGR